MKWFRKKKKVLVALSGGVDSSVAAALLVEQGHKVTAAFMVNFDEHDEHGLPCYTSDYRDAARVAAKLNIPIIKLDFVKEYKERVLDYMFEEYKKGRTPNPDVLCNQYIKFTAWLREATRLGFDAIATGHYASIKKVDNRFRLMQARDVEKDQTYFLHRLDDAQLSRIMFPLAGLTKQEVRELAAKYNLPTAQKAESMGICFVGEVPMKEFLQKQIKPDPGPIVVHKTDKQIGTHEGLPFYTIGQRHGFEQVGGGEPLFVVKKDSKNNTLFVGSEDDELLYSREISIENIHFTSGQQPVYPLECEVRLRHRQKLQQATVDAKKITFNEPQKAVTPGQFAVFYKGGECLGGAVVT